MICDLCGISLSALATRDVYGDRPCNFDICLACYSKLPEEHPQPNYKDEKVVTEENNQDEQDYMRGRNFRGFPLRPYAGPVDNSSLSSDPPQPEEEI